jgi:hypothetical protein
VASDAAQLSVARGPLPACLDRGGCWPVPTDGCKVPLQGRERVSKSRPPPKDWLFALEAVDAESERRVCRAALEMLQCVWSSGQEANLSVVV